MKALPFFALAAFFLLGCTAVQEKPSVPTVTFTPAPAATSAPSYRLNFENFKLSPSYGTKEDSLWFLLSAPSSYLYAGSGVGVRKLNQTSGVEESFYNLQNFNPGKNNPSIAFEQVFAGPGSLDSKGKNLYVIVQTQHYNGSDFLLNQYLVRLDSGTLRQTGQARLSGTDWRPEVLKIDSNGQYAYLGLTRNSPPFDAKLVKVNLKTLAVSGETFIPLNESSNFVFDLDTSSKTGWAALVQGGVFRPTLGLYRIDLAKMQVTKSELLFGHDNGLTYLSFSTDGKHLFLFNSQEVVRVDSNTLVEDQLLPLGASFEPFVKVAVKGSDAIVAGRVEKSKDTFLWVDLDSLSVRTRSLASTNATLLGAAMAPDSKHAFFGVKNGLPARIRDENGTTVIENLETEFVLENVIRVQLLK